MSQASFPPPNACDCHVHVVGPKLRFPLAERRSYTPMDAPLSELRAHLARLGLDRVVIVQPSFYGVDNACLLAALAELGPAARGVVALPIDTAAAEVDSLHRAGVRGIRLNMASLGRAAPDEIARLLQGTARLCARNGWHIQLFTHAETLVSLDDALRHLGVPIVIDHFGLVNPAEPDGAAARTLLKLLDSGRLWVKMSAPYRIADDLDDPNVSAFAERLVRTNPERLVWGTDWPHTPVHGLSAVHGDHEMPYREMDTAKLLRLLPTWCPKSQQVEDILIHNPARLYGFGEE
jgi:predicted TIM-barrel fold metal-dependent hydrolase